MPRRRSRPELRQYVGISRDHSVSMRSLADRAMDDYNSQVEAFKSAALRNNIDTYVTTVRCGVGAAGRIEKEAVHVPVGIVRPLGYYEVSGGSTPLFNSVWDLITLLEDQPDSDDPNVSFLVMAITDGENNTGDITGPELGQRIQRLQRSDRWTFVFRVPRGYKRQLVQLGIPDGNIQEWEQTEAGFRESTHATTQAVDNFYVGRTKGVRSTRAFYADMSGVTKKEVKAALNNVSSQVDFFSVRNGGEQIRDFVEKKIRKEMKLGSAFYQLTKPEKAVQDYKLIALRDKISGAVYVGQNARDLLGLPHVGSIKLEPGNSPKYDVFVQSTSVNRRLIAGTEVMIWERAAQMGRSAR